MKEFQQFGATRSAARQRGGSRASLILTLLVLAAMIFAAVKIVPLYVDNYQLQDAMQSEARFAIANHKADQDIRDDMWQKMQELDIPAKEDDLRVAVTNGNVTISLDYNVPVNLALYQLTLDFHPRGDNHTI
ncbi:MAG TPA: DUF4845 domain-containing protein [Candidatus Acidoferrales bacterium]|nr:DUF4845 domain-containing protein [Candidatus Acidoferrales bacterium]